MLQYVVHTFSFLIGVSVVARGVRLLALMMASVVDCSWYRYHRLVLSVGTHRSLGAVSPTSSELVWRVE